MDNSICNPSGNNAGLTHPVSGRNFNTSSSSSRKMSIARKPENDVGRVQNRLRFLLAEAAPATPLLPSLSPSSLSPFVLNQQEFQQQQMKVAHLNQMAIDLFSLKRYRAALFHFNEAFQTLVPLGDQIMLHQEETSQLWNMPKVYVSKYSHHLSYGASGGMFARQSKMGRILPGLPQTQPAGEQFTPTSTLMLPLSVDAKGKPYCLSDIQDWVLLSSRAIMFNGALAHFHVNQLKKAEELLVFAAALEDGNGGDERRNKAKWNNIFNSRLSVVSPRERCHRSVLVPIFHLLGKVRGEMKTPLEDETKRRGPPKHIEDAVDAFDKAIHLTSSLLGSSHMVVANIYTSLAKMLLQNGYIRGASFAFDAVSELYDRPRIFNDGSRTNGSSASSTSSSTRRSVLGRSFDEINFTKLSDDELSALLLLDGCDIASPAA